MAEQTKRNLQAGDITYTVKAMVQLVDLLDVQLRNLTPGGKDSAARSLNKVVKSIVFVRNIKTTLYSFKAIICLSVWINMTCKNGDL